MDTVVAVAGTLLGGVVGVLGVVIVDWRARAEQRRQKLSDASEQLVGAAAEHRQHQYLKIEARRRGEPDTDQARHERYAARTQVTKARAALRRATRDADLLELARQLVDASFALGDAPDDQVKTVGDSARAAHDAFDEASARAVFQHR